MPELPEVDAIVRGLRATVVGKTVASAQVSLKKMAVAPALLRFEKALAGERILAADRRGKYALLRLASGRSLVTSLRMTGRLVFLGPREGPPPYTYVELRFTDGTRLAFADVRQ